MYDHIASRSALAAAALLAVAASSMQAQSIEPATEGGTAAALTAFASAPTVVVLQWKPVEVAVGYRVFRRLGMSGGWCMVGFAPDDATEFEDRTVSGSSTYLYFVEALPQDRSAVSAMAIVTTPPVAEFNSGEPSSDAQPSSSIVESCGDGAGSTVHSGAQRLPSSAVLPAWLIEYENQFEGLDPLKGASVPHPFMH